MKKIFTLFAALTMVMSMSAATKTIYFKTQQWWHKDGAASAAYYWDPSAAPTWPGNRMTKVDGVADMWSIDVDTDKYKNIIFTRVNGSGNIEYWGAKTQDLVIPTDDKNLFTLSATEVWGDPGAAGTWSVYAPDAPKTYKDITITVVANATPKIHYWEGGDKVTGSEWETKPDMVATGEENTYSYTIKDVDEATGVKYLIVVGEVQSADQLAFENVNKNFKELLPQVSVMGVTGWEGDKMTIADDYLSASVTLNLKAATDYELKLTVNGQWCGSNAITITKDNNSASFAENGEGNGKLTTDLAGDYVFTYTYATKTLVVTYPVPTPTYTVTVTAENGSVEGLENEGVYEKGASVILTATAAEGYEFVNWTVAGEVVSTENSYTFVVSADVVVVANFKKAVEEHTITLSGLLKYSNEFRGYTTLQNVEGDTAFFVCNYVDGVPAYGEGYSVTANLGDLTLEGTGSWKLIDELETITAVLYNEERTAVYNVTVSAKAPEVHNLTCTDALYVENISEWMSELTITGVIDEAALKISVYDWQEATAGTYYQVMGVLNDEVYIQPESAEVTIVDTKLTIAFSAVDEFGNTYNVNVTATPKPNTPLVVENATFTVDGDNLTIQGQWETKSVVVALVGWSTTKYGEYNAVLMTGTGEAEDDIYAEFSAVLSKDGTTATLTGVAVNWDGTKYDVTISGLAPAEAPTALDNVDTTVAPVKVIENGQLIIIRNGVQYNAQGAVVK